jgi:hypothetical protein
MRREKALDFILGRAQRADSPAETRDEGPALDLDSRLAR